MKGLIKTLGLAAMLVVTASVEGATVLLGDRLHATYACTAEWHDSWTKFELSLRLSSYRAWPHTVQAAKITAEDGSIFRGKFGFRNIEEGTRLAGFTQYHITTAGETGSVTLSLVDSGSLWGSGVVKLDGIETTVLVNCQKH